jgi:ABC-2 type transport system permease protein
MRNPGFTESGAPDGINHNGTMFTSEDYFPKLGYVQASEISDRAERRKRGLGEPHRIPALDDRTAHGANFWKLFGFDADLITFETTVSTGADQVAIAPGNLAASWEKDGRRYDRYTMDKPILPFFSFQSGRWDVKKADWHGVPIEVYYDRKHPWNIDSMIKGSQGALDYFSANFGPYPHKALRITEFPLYLPYARSLPNTIPFSESLGFVNDLRGEDKVDHVFYVTAHEVAHQWWGDQLIPANTQGMGMLVESLAEYAALMAVEKAFGPEKVRHLLRWDLDQYFAGRAKELVEEQPLFKVEDQMYIQYRKGSLVFWRLREELGEDVLNRVLKDFLAQHCYQTAPYVTSRDLLAALRAAAPAAKQDLITDLFERIVFYDNRMLDAGAVRRADGKWDVTMKVRLAKLEADGKGKETARAYNEPIELAVFGRDENGKERVLWRGKRMLAAGESRVSVTVDAQPVEAGVDAYNLLIDRVAGDNRKAVSVR